MVLPIRDLVIRRRGVVRPRLFGHDEFRDRLKEGKKSGFSEQFGCNAAHVESDNASRTAQHETEI
jgi:hypothetical protein